jgi:hypothetical protein
MMRISVFKYLYHVGVSNGSEKLVAALVIKIIYSWTSSVI